MPAAKAAKAAKGPDPRMNRLVPYLDLFARLTDDELSRLAQVPGALVAQMRRQVEEICGALERYADLLTRLSDTELSRLTGANTKTIRFWRLCQPRPAGAPEPVDTQISSPANIGVAASSSARMRVSDVTPTPPGGAETTRAPDRTPVPRGAETARAPDRTPVPQGSGEAAPSSVGVPDDDDDVVLTVSE